VPFAASGHSELGVLDLRRRPACNRPNASREMRFRLENILLLGVRTNCEPNLHPGAGASMSEHVLPRPNSRPTGQRALMADEPRAAASRGGVSSTWLGRRLAPLPTEGKPGRGGPRCDTTAVRLFSFAGAPRQRSQFYPPDGLRCRDDSPGRFVLGGHIYPLWASYPRLRSSLGGSAKRNSLLWGSKNSRARLR